jgi:hypothetical protein
MPKIPTSNNGMAKKVARTISAILTYPWPFTATILLFITHVTLLSISNDQDKATTINTTISSLSQLFGISVIIYSLNNNIKLLTDKDILKIINNWFLYIYQIWKPKTVILTLSGESSCRGSAVVSTTKNFLTLDEKVDYLEKKINELSLTIHNNKQELELQLNHSKKELEDLIKSITNTTNDKIRESLLGNLSSHIFGILMTGYGIAVPLWT